MFVTFDGPDGTGKTTQAQLLARKLIDLGYKVTYVREPGGTPFGDSIRSILIEQNGFLSPKAELLLFNAARCHLVESVIRPALATGRIVICDRYVDSSMAYQGTSGIALEVVREICAFATEGLMPDRTFLFSLHPDEAQRRDQGEFTVAPAKAWSQFHTYRDLIAFDPGRWCVISGYLPEQEIANKVFQDVQKHPKFAEVGLSAL